MGLWRLGWSRKAKDKGVEGWLHDDGTTRHERWRFGWLYDYLGGDGFGGMSTPGRIHLASFLDTSLPGGTSALAGITARCDMSRNQVKHAYSGS